jgi:8-oxo-dGTP pyrophosphatase MutT (NUDIX family)
MQWDVLKQRTILKTVPFSVEELELHDKQRNLALEPYHRLLCPDWVNVLAVTPDHQAVLIRQSRAGSLSEILEVPGGCVDPGERDVTMSAARELEEETGFTTQRLLFLGAQNPNPATHNNLVHMFVGLQCVQAGTRRHFPDEGENIRVELCPVSELEDLVRQGRIGSALASLTIMLALKYLRSPTRA